MGDWGSKIVGGGRLGVKNCGRWEIGGQKLWEVGDWGSKIVGGGRWAPLCHPPLSVGRGQITWHKASEKV